MLCLKKEYACIPCKYKPFWWLIPLAYCIISENGNLFVHKLLSFFPGRFNILSGKVNFKMKMKNLTREFL